MHYRSGIRYNYVDDHWVITQELATISLYRLEGDFEAVAKYLLTEKESLYESYVKSASELGADYFVEVPEERSRSSREWVKLNVQFDKLDLEWGEDYDDEKVLRVWGTRGPVEEELTALEADRLQKEQVHQAQERENYERLKQKFEKA